MKTQTQKEDARADYSTPQGLARWWAKDGAWHIALPSNEPGAALGDMRWQDEAFDTREAAIAAIEGQPRHYDITNGREGWNVRESIGTAPWFVVANCADFGTAQKLKTRLQIAQKVPALVKFVTDVRDSCEDAFERGRELDREKLERAAAAALALATA